MGLNSLVRKGDEQMVPGGESNPLEEKSPEDFKFHPNEKSTSYSNRRMLPSSAQL
jgi:hypothetical protein